MFSSLSDVSKSLRLGKRVTSEVHDEVESVEESSKDQEDREDIDGS